MKSILNCSRINGSWQVSLKKYVSNGRQNHQNALQQKFVKRIANTKYKKGEKIQGICQGKVGTVLLLLLLLLTQATRAKQYHKYNETRESSKRTITPAITYCIYVTH